MHLHDTMETSAPIEQYDSRWKAENEDECALGGTGGDKKDFLKRHSTWVNMVEGENGREGENIMQAIKAVKETEGDIRRTRVVILAAKNWKEKMIDRGIRRKMLDNEIEEIMDIEENTTLVRRLNAKGLRYDGKATNKEAMTVITIQNKSRTPNINYKAIREEIDQSITLKG